jgi:ATP-dependent helicase HrpA
VEAGHPDNVHKAVLAGLLSHLGMRDGLSREFRGAYGSKFLVGKGSAIAKNPPKWLMAAELVETNRLWARMGASIKPEWAEQIAGPLVKYSYGEPTWDARSGRAVVVERATLYGLPIISGRTIGLDRVDRSAARDMFIQQALVDGDWVTPHRFVDDNRRTVDELRTMGDRARRADIIELDAVFRFYDERIGADVVSGRHFDQWWKRAKPKDPKLLTLTAEALLGPDGDRLPPELYPDAWQQGPLRLRLSYRFEPGSPDDGVTLHIPLVLLNQVRNEGFDWQVAGFRETLVATLAKTLPKEIRREMVPAAETVRAAYDRLRHEGSLAEAFAAALTEVIPVPVTAADVDVARIPDHLRITFSIEDDAGTSIARGKDLDELRRQLNALLRRALRAVLPIEERTGIVEWDLGTIPEVVSTTVDGAVAVGYPALLDDGHGVSLSVFTSESVQATAMTGGVRRLLLLSTPVSRKTLERQISNGAKLAMSRVGGQRWTPDALIDEALQAVADDVMRVNDLPWTGDEFAALAAEFKRVVADSAAHALQQASVAIVAAGALADRLDRLVAPALATSVTDARNQLQRLVRPGFVASAGTRRLGDVQRYLTGLDRRLDKLASDTARDLQRVTEVRALENRYVALLDRLGRRVSPDVVELGWQLEELRVGVFAQAVGTNGTVSVKRVQRALTEFGA